MQLLFLFLLFPLLSHAQVSVPQYLNFQSIVTDSNGNLITEPFIDLEFQVLDSAGSVLYHEKQEQVQVVKGAVNVNIGEGIIPNSSPKSPTGGLTLDLFDPREGARYVRMIIGSNPPNDQLQLLSTPYALWAEQALSIVPNSIGSEEIKNASIKIEDLEPGLSFSNITGTVAESQLPSTLAFDTDVTTHSSSSTSHAASQITVRGPFLASDAPNLEDVLRAIDRRVVNYYNNQNEFRDNTEATLQANIDTETATRAATDTTLQTEIDTEETAREEAVDSLTERIDNKKTITGSQDIFAGNSANAWIYQGRAAASVNLFFVGGLFSQAHYSEMPSHTHAQAAHDHSGASGSFDVSHSHSGTTDAQSVDHTHGGTTGGQSAGHSHSGSTGGESAGHSHGGTTTGGGDGSHSHAILTVPGDASDDQEVETGDGTGSYVLTGNDGRAFIEYNGHGHTISTGGASAGHSHAVSIGSESVDHSHSFSTGGASAGHTHSFGTSTFSGNHSHSISSVAPVIAATGTTTTVSLSSSEKTYLNGMSVFIDGVDRTSDLLVLLGWGAFGDGTSSHVLNDQTLASPGTGLLDVSSLFSTVGFHRIEFRQTGTSGGKVSWVIQVD